MVPSYLDSVAMWVYATDTGSTPEAGAGPAGPIPGTLAAYLDSHGVHSTDDGEQAG
jgi:hypothetical protein